MANSDDILGRKPARRPLPEPEYDVPANDDWKGEHHLYVQRGEGSGNNSATMQSISRKMAKLPGSRRA